MASNTSIQLKKSGVASVAPANLEFGEVAINYADGKLFYKNDLNVIKYINNQDTFGTINANNSLILASSPTDIFNIVPASGISIVPDGTNKRITLSVNESQLTNFVKKSGDTMTGDLNASTANITANNLIVETTLYSGLASRQATPLPNLVAQFTSNAASYVQVNAQNINPNGSADYVATADVGTDTSFYINLGLHNSQITDGNIKPFDGYLLVQGNTGQIAGNLVIGTISDTPGQEIRFVSGGYEDNNVFIVLKSTSSQFKNNVIVDGSLTGPTITNMQNYTQSAFDQANAAYNQANNATGTSNNFVIYDFPLGDYGLVTVPVLGGLGGELIGKNFDMRSDPKLLGLVQLDAGYVL